MDKEVPLDGVDLKFDPLPRSSTLKTPISPGTTTRASPLDLLITDIRITKRVSHFWTATDEYSFPTPSAPEPTAPASPPLQDSPRHAVRRRRVMRIDSFSSRIPIDQGYQGLWLGAERIWVGDLLRLSLPESRLDYVGTNPSYFDNGVHTERLNPEGEGFVFLKLKSLIPLTTERGREMHAIGRLYRLIQSPISAPVDQLELEGSLGLPRPPEGLAFKSMLSTNVEAQFSVSLIRGRYYPRLLSRTDRESLPEGCGVREMEGLGPTDSAVKGPVKYREDDRGTTIDAARSFVLG